MHHWPNTVDVLIESYPPGYLASIDLGFEALKELNSRLIVCSLTPFGQTGPWRDFLSSDLLHQAAGGFMALCGYSEAEAPGAPPLAPTGGQAWSVGGVYACIAIAAAVCQRDVTGAGQYLDVPCGRDWIAPAPPLRRPVSSRSRAYAVRQDHPR